jgi:hypothetical protein
MAKFTWGDTVAVSPTAPSAVRPGAVASIVGVMEEPRKGAHFEQFPTGTVYLIEYEDGSALDIHESHLEPLA